MMEIQLTENHKKAIERKLRSVAYWQKHPLSQEKCLNQFKRLREQRIARESKLMHSTGLQ